MVRNFLVLSVLCIAVNLMEKFPVAYADPLAGPAVDTDSPVLLQERNVPASNDNTDFEDLTVVRVADPYIELRTGPGRGYPIRYVVVRGGLIGIKKRKTNWFKVRTSKGEWGWVVRDQLERTLAPDGSVVSFTDPMLRDIYKPHWEGGVFTGTLDGTSANGFYLGRGFTENIAIELTGLESLGNVQNQIVTWSVVHYPFPSWRYTPYLTLGTGFIKTDSKAVQLQLEDEKDDVIYAGGGVRIYLTRRFFARVEYRNYVKLQNENENEELDEWKAGFNVYF